MIRAKFDIIKWAANKIKGHYKMKKQRKYFIEIINKVRIIQRFVTKWLNEKHTVDNRLREYTNDKALASQKVKIIENSHLYQGESSPKFPMPIDKSFGISNLDIMGMEALSQKSNTTTAYQLIKPYSPFEPQKVSLFALPLDFHILVDITDIYNPPWSVQWNSIFKDCVANKTLPQIISLGSTHTLVATSNNKLYGFGWNDNKQCGVNKSSKIIEYQGYNSNIRLPNEESIIKQATCGLDHSLILNYKGEVYSWGANQKGQLGLGNYKDHAKLSYVALPKDEIKLIKSSGKLNCALTKKGEVYMWPSLDNYNHVDITKPQILELGIKMDQIACGINFVVMASSHGVLYSLGRNAKEGQLGLGDTMPRMHIELISTIKDSGDKIDQISAGARHVVARTTLGKVYSWGWGGKGQLGHGTLQNELAPRLLKLEIKGKILQVCASSECTALLHESFKLFWFGTNSELSMHSTPIVVNLVKKFPEFFTNSDFCPVRIMSTWNRTLSLIYLTIADVRSFQQQANTKQKAISVLSLLASKWKDDNLLPPFIESIAANFSHDYMKKSATMPVQKNATEAPKTAFARFIDLMHAGPIYNENDIKNNGKSDPAKYIFT